MSDRLLRQFRERAEHLVAVPDLDELQRRGARLRRVRIAAGAAVVAAGFAIGAAVATTSVTDHDTAPRPITRHDQELPPSPDGPGLFTLPPVGAAPSTPEHGELVASMVSTSNPTLGDDWIFLYADGRLIWTRRVPLTGWVEQRLSPEGVDLVRTEILSTGLFDPAKRPANAEPNATWGTIQVRTEGQLVDVWLSQDEGEPWSDEWVRLHDRLTNLHPWLPDNAWEDRELKTYAPSRYAIWMFGSGQVDRIEPSGIMTALPASVQELLADATLCRQPVAGERRTPCFDMTTEEARAVAEAMDDAGIERGPGDGLGYQFEAPGPTSGTIYIAFLPYLPHGDVELLGG